MDENQKISIIMPVYNTGQYLKESLDSLFAQSFQQFELICVDDESDDQLTVELLKDYSHLHENMRVIRQETHRGAATARNKGFEESKSEYVIFLDSDDTFVNSFLEDMYRDITQYEADVCICGHYRNDTTTYKLDKCSVRIYPESYPYQDKSSESHYYDAFTAPWNKLCRREYLESNHIFFQDLKCSNDLGFSLMTLSFTNKIVCCDNGNPKIYYRWNTGNQISAKRDLRDHYRAYTFARERLLNAGRWSSLIDHQFMAFLLTSTVDIIRHKGAINQEDLYDQTREEVNKCNVFFEDLCLQKYLYWFRQNESHEWCLLLGDFDGQLKKNSETLDDELKKSSKWIIWGNGKRSIALQKYMQNHQDILLSVCESHQKNIGKKTEMGIQIISTEDIPGNAFIVASNKKIYAMLMDSGMFIADHLLNLENYCEFG